MNDKERFIDIGELWSSERGTDERFAFLEYDVVENKFVINEFYSPGMYARVSSSSRRTPAEGDIGPGRAYRSKAIQLVEIYLTSNPTQTLNDKISMALAKVTA
jgi:hypothetical protein